MKCHFGKNNTTLTTVLQLDDMCQHVIGVTSTTKKKI
jgi:hypothetical protein